MTDPPIDLLDFLLLGSSTDLDSHTDRGSVPASWAPMPTSRAGERRRPAQCEDEHKEDDHDKDGHDENIQSENMR